MCPKLAQYLYYWQLLNLFLGLSQRDNWLQKYVHFKFWGGGLRWSAPKIGLHLVNILGCWLHLHANLFQNANLLLLQPNSTWPWIAAGTGACCCYSVSGWRRTRRITKVDPLTPFWIFWWTATVPWLIAYSTMCLAAGESAYYVLHRNLNFV